MKKRISAIILVALLAFSAIFTSSCTGCFSDTTTSGTKYDFMMVSDLPYTVQDGNSPTYDTSSFKGAVWQGIKDAASVASTANSVKKYRYFEPEQITELKDGETYLDKFKSAVNSQLTSAINVANTDNNSSPVIVLPGDEYVPAYIDSKNGNEKAYKEIYTLIVGASPLSDGANTAIIHEKCYSIVINYTEMAYLSAYTAVANGYTKLGYLGFHDKVTACMLEGMILGAEKAASDMQLSEGAVEIKYAYATSLSDTHNAEKLFSECDIVMAENAELEAFLKGVAGDKAMMGVTEKADGAVQFSYHVSPAKLSETVKEKLNTVVKLSSADKCTYGIKDNMFNYSLKEGFGYSKEAAESLMKTVSEASVTAGGDLSKLTLTHVKHTGI